MITKSTIPILFQKEIIKTFTGTFDGYESDILTVFDKETSTSGFEQYQEMGGLGRHQVKPDGTPTALDKPIQGKKTIIENIAYALGYQITHEAAVDGDYPKILRDITSTAKSAAETRESVVFDRLNTAFSAAAVDLLANGQPLCSTAQPLLKPSADGTTTNSNRPVTGSSLSEASLTIDETNMKDFKDPAGLKMKTNGKLLVVPQELSVRTQKLLGSDLEAFSSNNAINVFKTGKGRLPQGFVVSQFLTDPDAYFIRTNHRGLIYQTREEARIMEDLMIRQFVQELISYLRFGVGASDHRSLYGNPGF